MNYPVGIELKGQRPRKLIEIHRPRSVCSFGGVKIKPGSLVPSISPAMVP
jgi:hypothetical protein